MAAEIPILQSLAEFRELLLECLDVCGVNTVVEIGGETGELTSILGEWAEAHSAHVYTIEPEPPQSLRDIAERSPAVELVVARSPDCLAELAPCDAYLIDADHNYHTVSAELSTIVSRSEPAGRLPLMFLHDVAWPWGRRDLYYSPDVLPNSGLRPHTFSGGLLPGRSDVADVGLLNAGDWAMALAEGGSNNGVQTAIDDFLAADSRFRYVVIPVIFGLGILYPARAPYAVALETTLRPLQDSPMLRRLEENRLQLIAAAQSYCRLADRLRLVAEDHERLVAEREASVAEKQGWAEENRHVRAQLDRLQAERDQLIGDMLEAHATIDRSQRQLARAQTELDRVRADRDRISLQLLHDERSALHLDQSITELKYAVAERDQAIASLLGSRSWRATAFLRALKRTLRPVIRR